MGTPTVRRRNLQQLARQLAALERNPDCPWHIKDAIHENVADLLSCVPVWEPHILEIVYPLLAEAAEKKGVDLDDAPQLEKQGRLTPDNTIEEARNPDSPLHGEFTWDLQTAAMMTWRQQARSLISRFEISVVVHRKEYRIQEFVEAPNKQGREQGYVSFTAIKNSKELAREFFDRELALASSYVSKTRDYAQALGLEKRVERAGRGLAGRGMARQARRALATHGLA